MPVSYIIFNRLIYIIRELLCIWAFFVCDIPDSYTDYVSNCDS